LKAGKTKQSTPGILESPSLAAAALQFACLQVNFQHEYLFILPLQRSKWSCCVPCCGSALLLLAAVDVDGLYTFG